MLIFDTSYEAEAVCYDANKEKILMHNALPKLAYPGVFDEDLPFCDQWLFRVQG